MRLASCSKSSICRRFGMGRNRPAVNPALIAEIAWKWQANEALIEFVGSRPGEGAVGAFAFGRSRGVVEGVLALRGSGDVYHSSRLETRDRHSAGQGWREDAALSEAIRRWPSQAALFARVKDDGRAEAALIAVAGLLRKGGTL